jgi:hypothetical protein
MRTLLASLTIAAGVLTAAWHESGAQAATTPGHRVSAHRHPAQPAFDVALYERYVRHHHRPLIPYRDASGKITAFAQAWMSHRSLCGGAMTAATINPTTLSTLQEWQGCTAVRRFGAQAITFHAEQWIN